MKYADIFKQPCPCLRCRLGESAIGRANGCGDKDGMVVLCTEYISFCHSRSSGILLKKKDSGQVPNKSEQAGMTG